MDDDHLLQRLYYPKCWRILQLDTMKRGHLQVAAPPEPDGLSAVMPGGTTSDFDAITLFLGDYGLFQVIIIVLITISAALSGCTMMVAVFLSGTPEHRCKEAVINSTRPGVEVSFLEESSWVGPDSCSRYKLDGNWTRMLDNETEHCVDGWTFSNESYTSTIVTEWHLVCDDAWKVPFSNSLFFAGFMIGTFFCSHLSDRFGRKPVFFFTMALLTATPLIQAMSVNWPMFCVLNGLRGLSVSNYIVSVILGCEMLSPRARVSFTILGHSLGYSIGYVLLPLCAYFIRSWRMLLVATASPGFIFIPAWWLIPESPRWLLRKGRVEEADLVIRNAAKRNKISAPDVIFKAGECLQKKEEEKQTYSYLDLIRTTNIRNITILSIFIWMTTSMVFIGLSLNTGNLSGDAYLNCFFSAISEVVAYVATWALTKRVSRPLLLFSMLMFCGVMLLVIKLVPEDMHVIFQVLAMVGKIGVSAALSVVYMFFIELIPTVVRNMGFGIGSTAARIGNIICPYIVYLGVYSKFLPYIIFGTLCILAAAVAMLLPDTRNSKLPDLISQAKPIRGLNSACFSRVAQEQHQRPHCVVCTSAVDA